MKKIIVLTFLVCFLPFPGLNKLLPLEKLEELQSLQPLNKLEKPQSLQSLNKLEKLQPLQPLEGFTPLCCKETE